MEKIIVLLSTYNGEKFLKEQVESILSQKDVELILFVRDDGSRDSTQSILKEYADDGKLIWMNEGEARNLGFRDSFLLLLKEAYLRFPEVKYFSFADQDDVWLGDKLSNAVNKLNKSDNKEGKLYYSNKICVDSDLNVISKDDTKVYHDFMEVLWNGLAYGCTMVFDRVLAEKVNRSSPELTKYHDSWVYRIAKCVGAEVIFDNGAYIYYRQHDANVSGEDAMEQCRKLSAKQIVFRVLPFNIDDRHIMRRMMQELYETYADDFTPEAKRWTQLINIYDKNLNAKYRLLINPEIRKRSLRMRARWTARIVFNML